MPIPYGQIVGASFAWNGRDPSTGLDCYGVLLWYYRHLDLELADPRAEYSEGWKERGEHPIRDRFSAPWLKAEKPWRPHDVLLITDVGDTEPAHLGVLLECRRKVLHAHPSHGVVCWPLEGLVARVWAVARHEALA